MGDVWWGLTEPSPKQYNFNGYLDLVQLIQSEGLQFLPVLSFHQCGGNVGDECNIPLPSFVTSVGQSNNNIWYHDRDGVTTQEYISLFADNQALFNGRTPLNLYGDYMTAFASSFSKYLGNTIPEIQVSLGPAGELRYPGYPLSKWQYCGIGGFQSYGQYAAESLSGYLKSSSDGAAPSSTGTYNNFPSDVCFFQNNCANNAYSAAGQSYLAWYTGSLITHGDNVLALANQAFRNFRGLSIAAKVSGIHWWFGDKSHAAEATSGYNMINGKNAYLDISKMLSKYNAGMVFTCFEMLDSEQDYGKCKSQPEELVQTVRKAANSVRVPFSAENALPRFDETAYNTIIRQSASDPCKPLRFTYLRLGQDLLNKFAPFTTFVAKMNQLGTDCSIVEPDRRSFADADAAKIFGMNVTVLIISVAGGVLAVVLTVVAVFVAKKKREEAVPSYKYVSINDP